MATGGSPIIKDDELQTSCSLCTEPYGKQRTPKLLPCFHTFCFACLTILQASVSIPTPDNLPEGSQQTCADQDEQQKDSENTAKQETAAKPGDDHVSADVTNIRDDIAASTGSNETTKAAFLCPVCRVPAHLPEGGVAALQTNFYLRYDDVKCDVCPEGNQQRADIVCQECNQHMCPSCRRYHDKWNGGHHVTPLNIGQPTKARSERKNLCTVHPDQAVCLYCRQCDSGICLLCKFTGHEGHVTTDIASGVVKSKSELPSLLTEAQQQVQVVQSSLRRVRLDERVVTRHAENLTQQIRAKYELIIASIARSRDELLEEISERRERARGQLLPELSSASIIVDTLSGLVSRASSARGNDVISVKKELQAALLSEDLLNHHRQRAIRQDPRPSWNYDVPEESAVPVTAYMGRVVEEAANDVTKPLSMAELAVKLGRLENDVAENKAEITQTKAEITQTKAEITQTKAEITQTKVEVKQHKAEITQNKAGITQNTTRVNKINTSVNEQADKIAKAGTRVVFTAVGIDKTRTKGDNPIVFLDVKVNEGGGYDGMTGVFTSPVAGTFIFSASVDMEDVGGQPDWVEAIIVVDSAAYAFLYGSKTSTGSNSTSVKLEMGQKVWVHACSNPYDYASSDSLSFTGALVQPQL